MQLEKHKLDYSPEYKKWLEEQGSFDLGNPRPKRRPASLTKEDIEKYATQHQKNTTS